MGYYSKEELINMGAAYVGENVKVSRKAIIYTIEKKRFNDNCIVDAGCILTGYIDIGKNVHIAAMCNIAGGEEGIVIEDFAGLAYGCNLFAGTDDYSGNYMTNPTIPDKYRNLIHKKIIIKKHSIVGASSVIFPGVTIEEGCSVGAMSLVTKSTEPWKIYMGIPAKAVSDRSKKLLELEKEYLKSTY